MHLGKTLLGLGVLGLAPFTALAQQPEVLVKEGDTVLGIGTLTSVASVAVNNSRSWIAEIDTSLTDTQRDGALLRNGFIGMREGTFLLAPAGNTADEWNTISLNNNGDIGFALDIRGTAASEGVFWNLVAVATRGQVIEAPEFFPANTRLEDIFDVRLNDQNMMLVNCEVENPDPGRPARDENTLLMYQVGNQGQVLSQTLLASEGMFIPAYGNFVSGLGTGRHQLGLNNHGDFIVLVTQAPTGVMINLEEFVAAQDAPSPVNGRPWKSLAQCKLAINDNKEYVVTGTVVDAVDPDAANYTVVKNGAVFALQGTVIPSFSPAPLGAGSSAPVYITNKGDVFWRAEGQGVNDDAFLRNYKPLVQLNRTVIDGNLVTKIDPSDYAFAVSQNGRFFAGRVETQGGVQTLVFIDFGLIEEVPGCGSNPGRLTLVDGEARVGQTFLIAMDDGPEAGAIPLVFWSQRPRFSDSPCGAMTDFGEVLVDPLSKVAIQILPTWNGVDPSTISIPIPNDIALVDARFFGQGVFKLTGPVIPANITLTNALRVEVGSP